MSSVRRLPPWSLVLTSLVAASAILAASVNNSSLTERNSSGSAVASQPAGDVPLIAGGITPSVPAIDRGQAVNLTANPSGGTPSYSFQWYSGGQSECSADTLISGATSQIYAPSPTANTYFCYNVTDSYAPPESATSATVLVLVNATLAPGAVTPASPDVDQGNPVTLSANPSAGTPPYIYQWYTGSNSNCLDDAVITGATGATYVASPATATSYCYEVTDSSLGFPAVKVLSNLDSVAVNPTMTVSPVSPSAPAIDSGQSVTLTAAASGGTLPYKYQWYEGSSSSCSSDTTAVGTNSTTYVASPTATAYFCYAVTDGSTQSPPTLSTTALVTVDTALAAGDVTPASPGIDPGQTASLTANPSGGTPTYSYRWFSGTFSTCSGDTVISGATSRTLSISPASSTYYCYGVTDSSSTPETKTSATALLTVNAALTASTASPSAPVIDSGDSVTLTANPTGGTPPYAFQWYSGTSPDCSDDTTMVGTNSATYTASPTASTSYCYMVSDSSIGTPAASATSAVDAVTVNTPLVAEPVTPAAPSIDSGQSLTLSAHPSGGTPIATVRWYSGPSPECSSNTPIVGETGSVYEVTPVASSFYCYAATDGSTNPPTVDSATDFLTVNSALSAGAVSPDSPTVSSGQSVTLTANPTGGTVPYSFQWYGGSSSSCSADTPIAGATGATFTSSPTTSTYYCYKVTDSSLGTPAASQLSPSDHVVVPPVFSFLGFAGTEAYALLGGIVAAVVVAVIASFLFLRRRKKRSGRISQLM